MARAKERQTSFAYGALDPELWGRTDLPLYGGGARTVRNFFVSPRGALMNRSGTQHLMTITQPLVGGWLTGRLRLVPFPYSATETALLMFIGTSIGGTLRVYERDGNGVWALASTIATLYNAESQAGLRFAQVGYILTVTSPLHQPVQLRRTSSGTYLWTPLDFEAPNITSTDGVVRLQRQYNDAGDAINGTSGDASHPPVQWEWAVTFVRRLSDGRTYETEAQVVTHVSNAEASLPPTPLKLGSQPVRMAIYADWPQRLVLEDSGTPTDGSEVVRWRIYRGREGVYGYIGETSGSFYVDDGATPNFSRQPPLGHNPFRRADGGLEYPASSAYFEGRRYFGGTTERPEWVWGSAVERYSNFDEIVDAPDDAALAFALAATRGEQIRALVPRRQLIVLTSVAEWLVTGSGQQEVITPNSLAAHPITRYGCAASPQPVDAASDVIFVQARGSYPIALRVDDATGAFSPVELALAASHLFDGYTIVDWAFAKHPYSILWVVRSDGALLSFTYVPSQGIFGWAIHELADDGVAESVAVFEDGDEDAVHLVVRRGTSRTLERLARRHIVDVRDGVFLDRSVSYDGRNADEDLTVTLTDAYSNDGDIGETVQVTFGAAPGTVTDRMLMLDSVRLQIGAVVSGNTYDAQVIDAPGDGTNARIPSALWGEARDDWAWGADTVGGLSHLDGLEVSALVDGAVVEGLTVTSGSVALPGFAAVVHVGRPYASEFESLASAGERGRQKLIKETLLELEGTRGLEIGARLAKLTELPIREISDSYAVMGLKRLEARVNIADTWAEQGYVALRQSQPVPTTVLGITRDVEYGG